MYRVHRLGHIEARSLELVLPDDRVRRARQAYNYMSLGFAAEIEEELGLVVEGIDRVRLLPVDSENFERRILIE